MKNEFELKDHWLVEAHLANMIDQGVVCINGHGDSALLSLVKPATRIQDPAQRPTQNNVGYQVVATLPESVLSMATESLTTRGAIRYLLNNAKREILISQPFIDNTFVDIFEEELRALAKKGTRFVLLTRKVSTDNVNIKGILKIYEMYALHSSQKMFEVYEHWTPLRIDQETTKQFVGLHAKVVLAEDAAYLGSANWTGYSLSNNVELGLMIKDRVMLHELRDLFFMVITQSARIDIAQIHQRITDRTGDTNG